MTSKERMRRAMGGETADRVPLMCQMSIGHMLLQTGHEPAALWNSAEVFAEGLLHRPHTPRQNIEVLSEVVENAGSY